MPDLVIVGAVESTRIAVEAAHQTENWRIKAIVTLPPENAVRHSDFYDLAALSRQVGAETIYATAVNAATTLEQIRAASPDLILVVGWSQICGEEFLSIRDGRVLGYHPAPLPRLRGRAALPWTILLQEPISGGTLFWVDRGIDSGAIMEQRFFHVSANETARTLYGKHMEILGPMVQSALRRVDRNDVAGKPQDDHYVTYGARRIAADGHIDWHQSTAAIDRLVRAVGAPYPGAFTLLGDSRIIIWDAEPAETRAHLASLPGQITAISEGGLLVRTGDGLLRVKEWGSASSLIPRVHHRFDVLTRCTSNAIPE